jgi:riboflavin kinase/FMN adenylyltransferase
LKNSFSSGNILSPEDKRRFSRELGIDQVILEDFERVRDYSPEEFCRKILLETLSAKHVFCGFNFRFGKNGAGDAIFLKEYLEPLGVKVYTQPPVMMDGEPVSSTRIREHLAAGRIEEANRLLGRPYSIRFPVLHGKHLGTRIGFPTVNQAFPEEYVVPKKGVYAVRLFFDGAYYQGVCNVGCRPTVDREGCILAETHLFDFSGDLYGKTVSVEFFAFLREETRFSSLEKLTEQISKDRETARTWWKEAL